MKKSHIKAIGIFLLKLIGTVGFLYWAISQIEDTGSLADNFKRALQSPFWVSVGLSLAGLSILTAALRLHILLRTQAIREPFSYIFRLTLYGALFNIASIGTAGGDAIKMIYLMRRHPDKKIGITISVMVDHLVGFLATGIIFLLFAWGFGAAVSTKGLAGQNIFMAATVFQAGGLLFIFISFFLCSPTMMTFCRNKLPKIAANKWVQSITSAMDLFREHWKYAASALVVSLALSAAFFLTYFAGLRSLEQEVSAATVLSVMPIVDVVASLPISISGLGVRERAFEFLLSQLTGIPTSAAIAASLIGFLFHTFWGLVGGIAFLTERSANKTTELDPPTSLNQSSHG